MSDFGGRMRLTIDGQNLVMRGNFKLDDADIEVTDGTNQDGSVWFSSKPNGYGAEVSLEVTPGISSNQIMRWRGTAVIVEEDTGVTHTFAQAGFSGKPMTDGESGEITGITLRGARYGKTKG